ncbi:hypothetical protein GIB67_006969 [Kingdonia uniflora]|uniref:Uncharacterized protein n=1 Tax=Kingdonia uniflora TaxID=39325 RepID=A0A7J7NZ39_9MAGN|nr:hypothetical protein GIB67_006969 [Kingdonia uniflora]
MISSTNRKSVDFYKKKSKDLIKASLSGVGLSIIRALSMMFLFGMELGDYLTLSTSILVIVDKNTDEEFQQIELNISFPAFSCEFTSVDMNDKESHPGYPSIQIFHKGTYFRDEHGQHDHESYYQDRDTETLIKRMEALVAPIPIESHKLAVGNKSDNLTRDSKRPAPLTGGCRIESFMRVKKVPRYHVSLARSESHFFYPSQMNISHVISHLSLGKKISPRLLAEVKRITPYLGGSINRLKGRKYINRHGKQTNVTIEHYLQIVKTEVISRRSGRDFKLVKEYEYTTYSSLGECIYIPVFKFHF